MFAVLEMEPQINQWAPTKNVTVYDKLINSFPKQNILLHREFYKLSNDDICRHD